MDVLCERQSKQIHKEVQSQNFYILTYEDIKSLAETVIKQASTNCFISKQIRRNT